MTDTAVSLDASLDQAFRHHQLGERAEAEALYRAALDELPSHRRALLLLAMLLSDGPDAEAAEAESLLRRRLGLAEGSSIDPGSIHPALTEATAPGANIAERRVEMAMIMFELGKQRQRRGDDRESILLFETATILKPDYAPAFNNLALSLHRIGRRDLALSMVERALAIDPKFTVALRNHGHLLLEAKRPEDARTTFQAWTEIDPQSVEALINLGIAALAVPDTACAEPALRCALRLDPENIEAHIQLANVLDHDHRQAEASVFRRAAARRHGVVHQPAIGSQAQARVLVIGGAGMCNLNLQFLLDRRRFDAVVTYLQPPGENDPVAEMPIETFPRCDVVINAVADADAGGQFLAKAKAFYSKFNLPVVNPADDRISRTTRDGVAALLQGIPGLAVPSMRRLNRGTVAVMALLGGAFEDPLLVRPTGAHGGDDLELITNAAELGAYLDRVPSPDFYVSEFHNYRSADGYWRKYRLIFVDREVYPYHLTIGKDWKLHYYRVNMAEQPWMKPEEEAFLADWRKVFGERQTAAVREVARRLDLDFAGIDCAIGPNGDVVLFEANPTMLVHLTESPVDYPHKHRYVPRIFDAFGAMVMRRSIVASSGARAA